VFRFSYVTLRIPLNMNFFRHPVFQIKQDIAGTGSLPVHRRKDMETPTPPALTQKILSALASVIKSSFLIAPKGIGSSMLCLFRRRKIPISGE
jgi:hypothetical protein